MNVLFWNCRGVGNTPTQCSLFQIYKSHTPDFICLAEPKVAFDSIQSSYWRPLILSLVAFNSLDFPSLWLLIDDELGAGNVNVFSSSTQHVTIECWVNLQSQFITCIYTHFLNSVKRGL